MAADVVLQTGLIADRSQQVAGPIRILMQCGLGFDNVVVAETVHAGPDLACEIQARRLNIIVAVVVDPVDERDADGQAKILQLKWPRAYRQFGNSLNADHRSP